MSVYVSGMVWKHSRAKGTTFTVLLAIADKCDDGGMAYPKWDTSIRTLAKLARVSERTAQYAINELIELGEVSREIHNGESSSTFQIHLDPTVDMFNSNIPKPVDKSSDSVVGGVQHVAGEGCNGVRQPVQPVAPNPSSVFIRQHPQAAARKKSVDKSVLPEATERWIAAGLTPPLIAWCGKYKYTPWAQLHFDYFCDYLRNNVAYAHEHPNHNASFMNSVRADWGDVRMKAQREARALGAAPGGAAPVANTCSYCPRLFSHKTGGLRSCGSKECDEKMSSGAKPKEVAL